MSNFFSNCNHYYIVVHCSEWRHENTRIYKNFTKHNIHKICNFSLSLDSLESDSECLQQQHQQYLLDCKNKIKMLLSFYI